jgi:hypothetical protein
MSRRKKKRNRKEINRVTMYIYIYAYTHTLIMDELRDHNFKGTQMTITKTKTNNTMLVHSRQCDHQRTKYQNKKQNGFNSIIKKKRRKREPPERKTWNKAIHTSF